MNILKNKLSVVGIVFISLFLTACDGFNFNFPPFFINNLHKYAADNGSDVYFSITIYYEPTSVSCFDDNVTMSKTDANTWSGWADYSNNLVNRSSGENSGINSVTCTATNAYGTTSSTPGVIELIPNVAPNLLIIQPISICGNDGTRQYNDTLVSPASTYISGASYTLTQGTLPNGLSVNYNTGKLVGTMAAGSQTVNSLKVTATTVAGVDESAPFSISISSTPCP